MREKQIKDILREEINDYFAWDHPGIKLEDFEKLVNRIYRRIITKTKKKESGAEEGFCWPSLSQDKIDPFLGFKDLKKEQELIRKDYELQKREMGL